MALVVTHEHAALGWACAWVGIFRALHRISPAQSLFDMARLDFRIAPHARRIHY